MKFQAMRSSHVLPRRRPINTKLTVCLLHNTEVFACFQAMDVQASEMMRAYGMDQYKGVGNIRPGAYHVTCRTAHDLTM
jgi:hypothetical protein